MYKLTEFLSLLEEFAPLSLSHKMIEKGAYDNSGIIVNHHDYVERVLFCLDLNHCSVEEAVKNNCDTIVTHHPAIYNPIKSIGTSGTEVLMSAIKNGINVLSMHLNLDVAKEGRDQSLANVIGGKNIRILDLVSDDCGYGREYEIEEADIIEFVSELKGKFSTDKILCYGQGKVKTVASFCGAGSSDAVSCVKNGTITADTIITSDIAHHNLSELIESGKNVIIIPHYVAEQKGFIKFYEYVLQNCCKTKAYYFVDKRFM